MSIIKVEGLGKSYTISHEERERYTALRDVIARKTKKFFTRHSSPVTSHSSKEEFWALKDINFEVQQGDRIGIIGRNGAGKSTLLKILSRITEPTTGSVKIKGRVASLLEVGTGFHPELTGAENIYLNGAILGMSRAEVKKKFDEIVDFAEVEKFLDTPVKRYSSGMYVRLAFAVAAHLEPEILVVDEVLAVGDAEFQKKCLGKMEDVSKNEGRTVLFVSHNMAAVSSVCNLAILLDRGHLNKYDTTSQVINSYIIGNKLTENVLTFETDKIKMPTFRSIYLKKTDLEFGGLLEINFEIISPFKKNVGIDFEIRDERGISIMYFSTSPMAGKPIELLPNFIKKLKFEVRDLKLASGDYYIYFWLTEPWVEYYCSPKDPLKFTVTASDPYKAGFDYKQSYFRGSVFFETKVIEES